MLLNFFQLNQVETAVDIQSQNALIAFLAENAIVSNAIYRARRFQPRRPRNVVRNKTFNNVSFRSTLFRDVEFRECTFEDCLFVGGEFSRCEIHHCSFRGCNFHKVRFTDSYIDPQLLIGVFDPVRHANIGAWVFQQLRSNALNTHQPEFFQTADWEFRRWLRFELLSEVTRNIKRWHEVWWHVFSNWAYEFFMGYGHSLRRFSLTSIALFIGIVELNMYVWGGGASALAMTDKVVAVDGIVRLLYYTVITLTTLGYGDITPVEPGGMLLAAAEALLGLVWFGMFTSIVVKKIFR